MVKPQTPNLTGRVCLITGGTSGIGKATALGLARLGATVIIHGRDAGRGAAAVEYVKTESGNEAVELLVADLASQAEVRRLAAEVMEDHDRLHVLINNAGAIVGQRTLTPEGYETTFAVNHLAPFLLTNLLLETLKASAPARVVNVASIVHKSGHIDFDNLQGERRYRAFGAYCDSKLANILFTGELARRLSGTGVTANCLHPGMVRTRLIRHGSGGILRVLWALGAPFSLGAKRGARTSLYLASSPEVGHVSGRYFVRRRPVKPSAAARDEQLARRLWEVSAELTGLEGEG